MLEVEVFEEDMMSIWWMLLRLYVQMVRGGLLKKGGVPVNWKPGDLMFVREGDSVPVISLSNFFRDLIV